MLTADMALSHDESYKKYIKKYAEDKDLFDADFTKAWYALTSADMGPATRCIGDMVPDPQPFQNPLPDPPENFALADFVQVQVAEAIKDKLQVQEDSEQARRYLKKKEQEEPAIDEEDMDANTLIQLALNCASTFRATDYRGGCNRAQLSLSPMIGLSRASLPKKELHSSQLLLLAVSTTLTCWQLITCRLITKRMMNTLLKS